MWGLERFGLIYFPQIESRTINESGEWISYLNFEALGNTYFESKIKVKGRYRKVDISGWIKTREACFTNYSQHASHVSSFFLNFLRMKKEKDKDMKHDYELGSGHMGN